MKRQMHTNDWIHTIAGIFILVSLALGIWVSEYWFLFTAFVGANLFQYGFSGICLLGLILKKFGVKDACRVKGEA